MYKTIGLILDSNALKTMAYGRRKPPAGPLEKIYRSQNANTRVIQVHLFANTVFCQT